MRVNEEVQGRVTMAAGSVARPRFQSRRVILDMKQALWARVALFLKRGKWSVSRRLL